MTFREYYDIDQAVAALADFNKCIDCKWGQIDLLEGDCCSSMGGAEINLEKYVDCFCFEKGERP